ncbi:MAG: hypothetical protein K0Q49_121 [Haloplasmataceae bacterium]|jgi:lia operon protein LiaG|nr:hypothetical protein [Haloplasmataceae bacterium]
MIKKTVIILLIIMLASFITSGIILYNTGGVKAINKNNYEINKEAIYEDIENVTEINIETTTTDINFINTDNNEIKINLVGSLNGLFYKIDNELVTSIDDNKLDIKALTQTIGLFVFSSELELNIYLPVNYSNKIHINTATGDINLSERNFAELGIYSTTGDVYLKTITTDKGNLTTTTGDIDANFLSGNYDIKSTTGDIDVSVEETFELNISTTTGDVFLQNIDNSSVKIETTTGDISLINSFVGTQRENDVDGIIGKNATNSVTIDTITGDVDIE